MCEERDLPTRYLSTYNIPTPLFLLCVHVCNISQDSIFSDIFSGCLDIFRVIYKAYQNGIILIFNKTYVTTINYIYILYIYSVR